MRYRLSDIDNERYYQLPKSLFSYPKYRTLSCTAKVIYAMLKDRMNLSRIHKWVDADGDIFLLFTGAQIGDHLGLSKSAVSREMGELEQAGLIDRVRQGQGLPSKIYIHKIEIPESEEVLPDVFEEMEASPTDSEDEPMGIKSCKYETQESQVRETQVPESQERESRVANMQLKGCINETQELQIRNSRVANMQPNETIYSETENSKTEKVRLKETQEEEEARARAKRSWESEAVDNVSSPSFSEILTTYQENISPVIGGVVKDSLRRFFDRHGPMWLMEAIREAVRHNHLSIAYIGQTLENWEQYGYKIRRDQTKSADRVKGKRRETSVFAETSEILDELRKRQERSVS